LNNLPKPKPKDIIKTITHPTTIAPKKISLGLTWYGTAFQVKSITNSTYYRPGQWMTAEVAQKCCDIPNWEVTMVDNDILGNLLGSAVSHLPLPI
jgi:hypothetical protein